MPEIKPEYFTQIGASEPMKIETLKLDPERLEIVKQILKQNQMILDFVLQPLPLSAISINGKIDTERLKNELSDYFVAEMK